MTEIDPDFAHTAFERRDRLLDGRFVGAVKTTGIYCKPSCPARRSKRENVEFFDTCEAARAAGYRPCRRCRPDEIGRDREAVAKAIALIERSETALKLDDLAAAVGYAPHHFQRLFKRDTGLTPSAYMRDITMKRAMHTMKRGGRITDAIYDAGYSGPSRFYAETGKRLGMTPSAWRNGGAGVTIRWTVVPTSLGAMLIAATDRGICRLSFDEGEAEVRRRFPKARIERGGDGLTALAESAVAAVENPARTPRLPLDIAGTAFQQAVWAELQRIPPGETRSYAQIAAAVGKPSAVRAAGSANGANNVAVLIPCHRVVRSDGGLGGYAYGLDRKQKLLDAERNAA